VLALAALCIAQWQRDRRLNLELGRLDQVRLQQAAKIDEQASLLKGLNEDLGQLKTSLTNEQSLRSQVEQKVASSESANRQLTLERDQLKAAITNWANAVALRDERMKEANTRIEQLAADLNASIRKYNELATNRNAAVKTSGATRAQP
jgi:chromosome segregation ATPase